ncbi:MAG TPA: helix-turn-helix domain-containing protein [Acidimicrobiales bacterium]|nr:helix-turn-helix domain-containing protein [Acidimicrobiales bacterium]
MALEDLPEFLTVEEAAEVLRISRTSAYLLTQRWRYTRGQSGLPVQRLGRLLRVPRPQAIERMAVSPGDAA